VRRERDPEDARATRAYLTAEARRFAPVAERVLAALERRAAAVAGAAALKQTGDWLRRFARL
jgi:DNA-binding MarR family transcriptional regulator